MRDDLEAAWDLFEGMPLEGQKHWRERALPSVTFESDAERHEFIAGLDEREKNPAAAQKSSSGSQHSATGSASFAPGQRVKANLAGLQAGGVQFSQNVEAAYGVIDRQVSAEPPVYHVRLLITFRGVSEIDVP